MTTTVVDAPVGTPWITVTEAAARARCGSKAIYREVTAGRLRATRLGGRRELRFRAEWVDEWLLRAASPEPPAKRGGLDQVGS